MAEPAKKHPTEPSAALLAEPPAADADASPAAAAGRGGELRRRLADKWQVPLLILGFIVLLSSLPRMKKPPAGPVPGDLLAQAHELFENCRYGEAVGKIDRVLASRITSRQRIDALSLRVVTGQQRVRFSRGSEQRFYLRQMLEDMDKLLGLVGSPEKIASPLLQPVRFHLYRGQGRLALPTPDWAHKDKGEADLLKALDLLGPDQHELRRQVIDSLWDINPPVVHRQLDGLLAREDLPAVERLWAVSRRARLLTEEAHAGEAIRFLTDELSRGASGGVLDALEIELAQVRYDAATSRLHPIGPAERDAHLVEAMRLLEAVRLRRDPVAGEAERDARLHWLLGELHYLEQRPEESARQFDAVVRNYQRTPYCRAAQLGLAKSQAMHERFGDALASYRQVVEQLRLQPDDRLVDRQTVQGSLLALFERLKREERWEPAHQSLTLLEQILDRHQQRPSLLDVKEQQAESLRRLALQERQLADKRRAEGSEAGATQPDHETSVYLGQAKRHYVMAAETFLAAALIATKDGGRGARDLKAAAECYDQAGELPQTISVLRRFIREHPSDHQRLAWAIFNLAKSLQAAGQFEEAIAQFQRLTGEFANAPDANKSLVPMAQCFKSLGDYDRAEEILGRLLANDEVFTPESEEWTEACFEMARLNYDRARYRQAIAQFDEALQRYPRHAQALYSRYYLADSYRRCGLQLDPAIASAKTLMDRQQLAQMRTRWLHQAREQFDGLIGLFEAHSEPDLQQRQLDWLYLRNSYFFRADSLFELGQYEEAIRLYDQAALKYQGQPEALAAYVQVVNCYQRLNRPEQARTANERARWLLKKLSPNSFAARPLPLDREYFDQWLQWAGQSGMW